MSDRDVSDGHDLQRFVTAQDRVIDQVRDELRSGHKRTHWMWFVFPQVAGLGHSAMAQRFALASTDEAVAYAAHAVLGPRLVECVGLVLSAEGRSLHEIFGSPDDMKFHGCVTLFEAVPNSDPVFARALHAYFSGRGDAATLARL